MGILKQLEVDYDIEIVGDFLSHYAIMCENMEPLIIGLSKENRYGENIDDLFRIFHNMKSAAAFLRLDPIIKLAALCEDIVEEARMLRGPASEPFIDWLLLVSDQFEKYRKDVEGNAPFFTVLNPLIIKVPHMLERA
ncbi:Hpt domain-containing protein [Sulfurospirillum barnesii]|uniref:Chemotaxis protein histidine kinase-like protein n=1 Tax=Sulfurospirillum barnesii (strain ATCC 700032 / DSM 10660 / SES-3) TaxID=760154 RepID=I3XUZ1_SULBS|nr:Hpt domain-containing protein [Sulfurospirillum barnesii]AFL67765.1 chemotaxis protein histidine kinase-like protein [Sulfurospirillum barnesii SES-3]